MLINLKNFLISKEIGIEAFKIAFTALIGLFTFTIYQRYRNKKDNSSLYIKMIKLEKEIRSKQQVLKNIIDSHSEYDYLYSLFREEKINNLFEHVYSLYSYYYEAASFSGGDTIIEGTYTNEPYQEIEELENEIYMIGERKFNIEDKSEEIISINKEIEELKNKSIYDLLIKIEKFASEIDSRENKMGGAIEFLKIKLNKFNSNEDFKNIRELDKFCSQLLDEKNIFSNYSNAFKDYKNTKFKDIEEIEFKLWDMQEMNLLGVYNPEDYLLLEEFYQKNKIIRISHSQLERAVELSKEMEEIYEDIILKTIDVLKKTLKKMNWLFKRT